MVAINVDTTSRVIKSHQGQTGTPSSAQRLLGQSDLGVQIQGSSIEKTNDYIETKGTTMTIKKKKYENTLERNSIENPQNQSQNNKSHGTLKKTPRPTPQFWSLILCSISAIAATSCGPQTDSSNPIEKHFEKTSTVKEDASTSLEIASGSAKGTAVDIQPGSLAIGSEVSLSQVDTPTEFAIENVSEASPAIQVDATASDGSAITALSAPMTIAIPYEATTLLGLAAVDKTIANLCAVMIGPSGKFVWRRSGITLDETSNKASFKSLNLGIFQLVYCGEEAMVGFEDAVESGAAETRASMALTINTETYGFGDDHYCVVLLAEDQSSSQDKEKKPTLVIGRSEVKIDGTNTEVKVDYSPDNIPSTFEGLVAFASQSKEQTCSTITVGADIDTVGASFNRVFVFPFSRDDFIAGKADGSLGDGVYKLEALHLLVGAPSSSTIQGVTPIERMGCVEIESDNGFSESGIRLDASGNINGNNSFQVFAPAGASSLGMKITIGAACGPGSNKGSAEGFEPYQIQFNHTTFNSDQYLFPFEITMDNRLGSGVSCLRMFDGTGLNGSGNNSPIGSYNVTIGQTHSAYVPWDETQMNGAVPEYDMEFRAGSTCDNNTSQVPPIPFQNEALRNKILLAPQINLP